MAILLKDERFDILEKNPYKKTNIAQNANVTMGRYRLVPPSYCTIYCIYNDYKHYS